MEKNGSTLPVEFQSIKDEITLAFMADGLDGANKVLDKLETESAAATILSDEEGALEAGEAIRFPDDEYYEPAKLIDGLKQDSKLALRRFNFGINTLILLRLDTFEKQQ